MNVWGKTVGSKIKDLIGTLSVKKLEITKYICYFVRKNKRPQSNAAIKCCKNEKLELSDKVHDFENNCYLKKGNTEMILDQHLLCIGDVNVS